MIAPGTPILVHATVERCVGSAIEARVGADLVHLVDADLVKPLPETVPWCGRTWTVLARDGGEVWMRCGGCRIAVPEEWIGHQQVEVKS